MSQLVSIVVPAYNRARMIEPTLLSIAAQDYENMEIIVVDDGSSDDTGGAAESVLKGSGRKFKVLKHDTNRGECAARNTGLSSASGDYVIFFDSDDLADPNFVSVLWGAVTENDSDVAFGGFRIRSETGEERILTVGLDPSRVRKYTPEELTIMWIFHKIRSGIWTAIYKMSFLKETGLEFTEGCQYLGDLEFFTKALARCGRVDYYTGCHYIYVQHEGMISRAAQETPDKLLRRRVTVAEAVCREARYLAEYAASPKVREIAANFILADGLIKTMNIAARQGDKTQYYRTLHAPETKRALTASLRYLTRDPEVSLKAAALLIVPRLYFWIRSKI